MKKNMAHLRGIIVQVPVWYTKSFKKKDIYEVFKLMEEQYYIYNYIYDHDDVENNMKKIIKDMHFLPGDVICFIDFKAKTTAFFEIEKRNIIRFLSIKS